MTSPQIAPARPASTVIVMRPHSTRVSPPSPDAPSPRTGGDAFEILLVRRADKVAFMAGSYVFPGGRVDESDRPPAGERLAPPTFPDLNAEEEATYRMAAVRELQEEANVYITVDDLHPFAHWVTPEIETRRFDTRFFLARMPEGQQARHDEGETAALEWLSPREAIARFQRRDLMLPPPTWTSLRQLAKRTSIEDAMRWATSRQIVRVMPGFVKNEREFILTLPGDPLLPAIPGWEIPEETRFVLQEGGRWEPLKA
jgi:8-oxo-dGTP pyrophosphatase MutT (NUDIX family)